MSCHAERHSGALCTAPNAVGLCPFISTTCPIATVLVVLVSLFLLTHGGHTTFSLFGNRQHPSSLIFVCHAVAANPNRLLSRVVLHLCRCDRATASASRTHASPHHHGLSLTRVPSLRPHHHATMNALP